MSPASVKTIKSQLPDTPVSLPELSEQTADDLAVPHQAAPTRRFFVPIAAGLLALAAMVAALVWWQFVSSHVVTSNALVRSHLSELGIRGEGVVADVLVRAGDYIEKGQLLAKLDDASLLAQRAQVLAKIGTLEQQIAMGAAGIELRKQQSEIELERADFAYQQMMAEAEAAALVANDSRAFHAARSQLERTGAVSAEVIRDAAAKAAIDNSLAVAADAAAAGTLSKRRAARLARESIAIEEAELRVFHARRSELLAELQRIDADIQNSRVFAPEAGAVIRRLAQPGMAVTTGMPLLSVWLTEDVWVEAWIPEERLSDVTEGAAVTVSFPALKGQQFTARLERIGLATDYEMPLDYLPQTRAMRMRPTPQVGVLVRLEGEPPLLRPGMSAVVDINRVGG